MDGRQKPDPKLESENDLNDEEIIDLTQVVDKGVDDDIIDLTEVIEQPDQVIEADGRTDEEVLPLVDIVSTAQPPDLPEEADDEIINLTDVAEPEPEPDTDALMSDEEAVVEEEEDDVIDLLDVAASSTSDDEEAELSTTTATVIPIDQAENNIDMESTAEPVLTTHVDQGPDLETDTLDDMAKEADVEELTPIEVPVAATPFVPVSPPESPIESEPVPLTEEQVDAALERVIKKMYGEKIEQLMIQSIEKTIKREIEKIKTALLEDTDDMVG